MCCVFLTPGLGELPDQKLPHNFRHGHPVVDSLYFQGPMEGYRNINRQPFRSAICCGWTSTCCYRKFLHLNNPVFDNVDTIIFAC
jgi:hypothetical protein